MSGLLSWLRRGQSACAVASGLKVCAVNQWRGFTFEGITRWLLERATGGPLVVVEREDDADLAIAGIFTRQPPKHPRKTILISFENGRPDYNSCRYSLCSDFDSYGGRNHRLPAWYGYLGWPGLVARRFRPNELNHGHEPLIDIDTLSLPRPGLVASGRPQFCALVAGNPEPHRLLAAERLGDIGRVDLFGNVANRPLRRSKIEALQDYRFNLCFENSAYPGYYTEKLLHAWAAGCVPLYYSDPWYARDFNQRALINRIDFASLDDFARHVAKIARSPAAIEDIVREPLLLERPDIEPAIAFLRKACADILR